MLRYNGTGQITLNVQTSIFQYAVNLSQVTFGAYTISFDGVGSLYGMNLASAMVSSLTINFASLSGSLCYGIIQGEEFFDTSSSNSTFDSGFCIGTTQMQNVELACTHCNSCDPSCDVCSDSSNSQCSSCNLGYFLQPSFMGCDSGCPPGFYGNSNNGECAYCHQSCASCSGSGSTACTSCNVNYYRQPNSSACLGTCPSGYYQNNVSNVCQSN